MDDEAEMSAVYCVSVYLVDRAYGGPEEGGWYFDFGEPVIPKPHFPLPQFFTSREDAIEHRDEVQEKLDRDFNCHLPPISSVLSQGRYAALIDENSYPKHWPERRPNYE